MQPQIGEDIGMGDKKGKPFRLGDYVRRDLGENNSIMGQIIYGYHSTGYDEWEHHYRTLGFFIKYKDESGTTGIDSDWIVIDRSEYDEED